VAGTTSVLLITGFLGSGKTTFLNRVIRVFPPDRKLMVLMNEFGEMGIDGQIVEGEDLDMLEISKGSIFCVCVKTDFIRGLANIARDIQPDMLIIEATGVANPADLKRDLKLSIFQDRFQFKEQVCLIDAENFMDTYEMFTSVEKQIETSTVFIINKKDLAHPEEIDQIKKTVCKHHPDPEFFETTYADISLERISPILQSAATTGPVHQSPSEQDIENAIEELLQNPQEAMTPPDRLLSAVYTWQGGDHRALEKMAAELPKGIVRAKGLVRLGKDVYLFSRVMETTDIARHNSTALPAIMLNRLVSIGSPEALDQLEEMSRTHICLTKQSSWNPMAQGAGE